MPNPEATAGEPARPSTAIALVFEGPRVFGKTPWVGACTSLRIPVSFAVSSSVISVSLPSFPMGETGDHGTGGHDEQDNHDDGDEDDDEYDVEEENKSMELAAR